MKKRTSYIRKEADAEAEVPVIQIVLAGGAVSSVNGRTGDVVLDAADVGAMSREDVAAKEEAQEVLNEVFAQGGIAPPEDAKQILDGVFGTGGVAPAADAKQILDGVFGNDPAEEPPTAQSNGAAAKVASVSDARRILKNVFGAEED